MVAFPFSSGRGAAEGSGQSTVPPLGAAALRIFDIVAAVATLTFFFPLMVLVGAAILVESGGPIFYSQVRLSQRGRHFRMHKFRKFHAGEGPAGRPLTMEDDPRLTRVGGFLLRTKLDELPQLWNVLKGDMSIVGPRPESLDFRDCFEGPYGLVLEHKPGIFGPSQVLTRNECFFHRRRPDPEQFYRDVLFPLKAQIDLAYFAHRTLFRDLGWAVRGSLAVFGWSSLLHQSAVLVEEAEHWAREDRAGSLDQPAQSRPRVHVGRWGAVEIVRGRKAAITGTASAPTLDSGRQCATDQGSASKGG
jgi:lipopolysaccharide/colanic/teichoic acid biosynthesis glycosyltransferase